MDASSYHFLKRSALHRRDVVLQHYKNSWKLTALTLKDKQNNIHLASVLKLRTPSCTQSAHLFFPLRTPVELLPFQPFSARRTFCIFGKIPPSNKSTPSLHWMLPCHICSKLPLCLILLPRWHLPLQPPGRHLLGLPRHLLQFA